MADMSSSYNKALQLAAIAIIGLMIYIANGLAAADVERQEGDCVYAGQVYSDGAVMQQGDRMMECSNGTWVQTREND